MGEESAEGRRAQLRPADWAVALAAALAVLLVTGLLADRNRDLTLARAAADDWRVVNDVVLATQLDLEAFTDQIEQAAVTAPSQRPREPIPGVVFGEVTPSREVVAGELTPGDLERPELVSLLGRAVDTGAVASLTPLFLDGGLRSVVAVPVLDAPRPPTTVQARRDALQQWVVATLDLGAMAAAHLPEGAGVRVTVGDRTFVDGAGRPYADVGQRIDLRGYVLDVRAGSVDAPAISGWTWAILLVGLAAAAGVAVRILVVRGRSNEQAGALARGEAQAELIAEVAPIVQQSLDLADVLPAIAVQLRDHFGLSGIHLAAGAGARGEVEIFGLGANPAPGTVPVLAPPAGLAAGESLSLALQRAGRSVARLDLVAGRDLVDEELRSLRVLTELVTAAVVNANLYAAQQDAVRRLRDLDALKTVFLSTASHELRTPATAIGGFASLLEQRWDAFPEDRRLEMVSRIAANARSLGAVVEDLLDFSLLDRREQPLPVLATDLGGLTRGVVDRLSTLFGAHTIDVRLVDTPPVVGEQSALERVVTNLLTNAAKFSPPGTTVSVVVEPAPGGGRLVVCDQGPGVPEADRARIFTRFYRGSGEAVVQTRGVGIGLSVVMELVERLGGTVEVDDAPGGGARFAVWLPAWAAGDGHQEGDAIAQEEVEDAPTR
jgi:signal transduction histidine kinase